MFLCWIYSWYIMLTVWFIDLFLLVFQTKIERASHFKSFLYRRFFWSITEEGWRGYGSTFPPPFTLTPLKKTDTKSIILCTKFSLFAERERNIHSLGEKRKNVTRRKLTLCWALVVPGSAQLEGQPAGL